MTVPPTESGEGDPGQVTRIAEEFIRLHESGKLSDLDEFCARYPEKQRASVRHECEQLLRIRGVIKQPERLSPGQRLGSYEIKELIGSGGMGEVYRARDSKLDRDVAIKVLPPELASQPERVKRFEREAKAIAAIDHPNIVTIHSVEESDGLHFITMQLIEGKTLSDLIPKKGLGLARFFDLAIPLTDALSCAHEQGITHRDLKPANIMVTAEGRVEILDFGLAKLTQEVTPDRTTKLRLTSLTDEGQIVGTVAYMSPEQAEGKPVDHRSDIFSLGIILYEMVTGQRPFKGETRVALMSSITKETPQAITELNAGVPRHLGRIVRRCLAKDIHARYQTAKDVRIELVELKRETESGETVPMAQPPRGRRWFWPAVSGATLLALVLTQLFPNGENGGRIVVDQKAVTESPGRQLMPSMHPFGTQFLYVDTADGRQDIYLKSFDGGPINLTEGLPAGARHPVYSPDGQWIAFEWRGDSRGIYRMPSSRGQPQIVSDTGYRPDWSRNGKKIVYSTANEVYNDRRTSTPDGDLWVVDLDSSRQPELLFEGRDALDPSWSPAGERIAFWGRDAKSFVHDIWTVSSSGDEARPVTDDRHNDWGPFWSADGHYLYFLSTRGVTGNPSLWRIEIDQVSGETNGDPEEVWSSPNAFVTQAGISTDGSKIVCTLEDIKSTYSKIRFDIDTGLLVDEEWDVIHESSSGLVGLALSPDDQWLASRRYRARSDVFSIPVDGADGEPPIQLTSDAYDEGNFDWYPKTEDGVWLALWSEKGGTAGIYVTRPNRVGLQPLRLPINEPAYRPRWSPDGEFLSVWTPLSGMTRTFAFPDGLLGDAVSVSPENGIDREITSRIPSPLGGYFAELSVTQLRVVAKDGGEQFARDERGQHHRVQITGSPWLDEHRLIYWERLQRKMFLWDIRSNNPPTEIVGAGNGAPPSRPGDSGLSHSFQFALSRDGRVLYRVLITFEADIWLLTIDESDG